MVRKFDMGQIVWSRGVSDMVIKDKAFARFAANSLKRHSEGDWGNLSPEEEEANELALKGVSTRILSAYEAEGLPKIWIITEADKSMTTILFPEERHHV
ncbi:MAG: hypothetical protein J7L92_00860 [Dehalococcoidia bacterium]|nr:hypothetical protein [Dehalococcoidia bacterium]